MIHMYSTLRIHEYINDTYVSHIYKPEYINDTHVWYICKLEYTKDTHVSLVHLNASAVI